MKKSSAYCVGMRKKPLTVKYSIKWASDIIDTLGVKIPLQNREDLFKLNYNTKIASMENIMKSWSARNLSLRGKVVVIKSLLLSKFQYLVAALGIPDQDIIRKINRLLYKFLWKGSEKLKRSVMINNRDKGGIDMPDFETICKCSMIKWVHRYIHSDECNWKKMIDYTLRPVGGKHVF